MAIFTWETGCAVPRSYNGDQLEAILQTPLATLLEPENVREADTGSASLKVRQDLSTTATVYSYA